MPWSPVPKIPQILEDLRKNGYTMQVNMNALSTSIIRVTGVYTDKGVLSVINVMEKLGYIRKISESGVWDICQGEPYVFANKTNHEVDKELEKYI